jgi:hypothetical protein
MATFTATRPSDGDAATMAIDGFTDAEPDARAVMAPPSASARAAIAKIRRDPNGLLGLVGRKPGGTAKR